MARPRRLPNPDYSPECGGADIVTVLLVVLIVIVILVALGRL